jgi:hypothetical protein
MFLRLIKQLMVLLATMVPLLGSVPPDWATLAPPSQPATAGLASAPAAPATAPRQYRVALQSGHYKSSELPDELSRLAENTGTAGGGRTEVDLNFDVSNRVAKLLRAQGILVDVLPATVSTGYSADAFIAIHADGNASSKPRGFKISTRWSSKVAFQDGQLVETLTDAYRAATGLPEDSAVTRNMRGYYAYSPRRANYRVSNFTPGAIVEMGYMTNSADRAVLFNSTDKVASGIANGIVAFLKATYGSPATDKSYGFGYGIVDKDINPRATPAPRPPGSGGSFGSSRPQTGDWQVLLMGKPTISVYTGPGGEGPIIAKVALDQFLHATVRQGDYYKVTLPDGRTGWINRISLVVQM